MGELAAHATTATPWLARRGRARWSRAPGGVALLASLGALMVARPAAATRPLREFSLEELLELEVVTPTAKAQPAAEAPATIYVITAEMIQRRGYRHLGQLLEDVPEIQIDRNSAVEWGDGMTLRGINGNRKFIILLDGFRLNSATGNPHSIRDGYSLANVERVEVVLGPASALYGADAFAGVVQLISRSGAQLRGGSATASYGRFGTTDESFVIGGEAGGAALALWGSVYHADEPPLPDFYRDEFAWYHERYLPRGEVRVSPFSPSDQVMVVDPAPYTAPRDAYSLHGRLDLGDLRLTYARIWEAHSSSTSALPEFSLYVADARWAYRLESIAAQHQFVTPGKQLRLTSALSFQRYEVDPDSGYVNTFNGYNKRFKYSSDLVARIEERATFELSERWTLSAGASFEDARALPKTVDLGQPFDPDVADPSQGQVYPGTGLEDASGRSLAIPIDFNELRYRNLGGYAEAIAVLHSRLSLTAGLRLDHDTRYGATINPRAGAVLRPLAATRIKLLYGEAYLTPTPFLAYQHFGAFSPALDESGAVVGLRSDFFFLPNPALEPEKLRTLEISLAQTLGPLRATASGYYTRVRGLITQEFTAGESFKGWPVDTVGRHVNQGQATIRGGALGGALTWRAHGVTVQPSVTYGYTGGTLEGRPLPYHARHTLKGVVDVSWRDLSLSTRVLARGKARHPSQTDAAGEPLSSPASAVVNLHARWSDVSLVVGARVTVFASIDNLLDTRYFHLSDETVNFAATPQDPLRVLIGVTIER